MSDQPIDILLIGLGAVGTIYSWILSQNKNVQVTAIARSSYEEMNAKGIEIRSDKFGHFHAWKPYRLVKDTAEANDRAYKYIIVTTKALPDILPTASILAPFLESNLNQSVDLEDGPTVVLIQNGIGIEHGLQTAYPQVPIISVVAWIGANLHAGPLVTHGMMEKLIMGLYLGEGGDAASDLVAVEDDFADPAGYRGPGGSERREEGVRRTKFFAELLTNGGGCVEVFDDIQPKRYEKNIWNAAWSSMCALSRCTVSSAVAPAVLPYTLPVIRRTMLEVMYVARAWGYQEDALPLKAVDEAIKITIKNYQKKSGIPETPATPSARADAFGSIGGYGFPTGPEDDDDRSAAIDFKPSMLLDVEAGRPCELEPIIGSLLDRARAKGVATPRLDVAYSTLKIHQELATQRYAASPDYQQHIQNWLTRPPNVAGLGAAGRQAWEKAVRKSGLSGSQVASVHMAGGKDKIPGKPIHEDVASQDWGTAGFRSALD
ncbi:uncharacterized protein JCM15063_003303 [Sporobolomyces koalae]|uniref:uncharacterized protein n=1 Tax=Sporobolomyces koalae TaxID=500713 RepID=UPI003182A512